MEKFKVGIIGLGQRGFGFLTSNMSITPLTEKSIALGGVPVEIPDFTNGNRVKEKCF